MHGSVLVSTNRLIAVITNCAHALISTLLFVDQPSLEETTGWIKMRSALLIQNPAVLCRGYQDEGSTTEDEQLIDRYTLWNP